MARARAKPLHAVIEEAFADARYPGDDRLVYGDGPKHMGCLECAEIARKFRGKQWKDVPLDLLHEERAALTLFTPEAYRFYLPAFLTASVRRYKEAGDIPFDVVASLAPPRPDHPWFEPFLERMNGFSSAQRAAIRAFLARIVADHGADHPDAERALLRYWAVAETRRAVRKQKKGRS